MTNAMMMNLIVTNMMVTFNDGHDDGRHKLHVGDGHDGVVHKLNINDGHDSNGHNSERHNSDENYGDRYELDDKHKHNIYDRHEIDGHDDDRHKDNNGYTTSLMGKTMMMDISLVIDIEPWKHTQLL